MVLHTLLNSFVVLLIYVCFSVDVLLIENRIKIELEENNLASKSHKY